MSSRPAACTSATPAAPARSTPPGLVALTNPVVLVVPVVLVALVGLVALPASRAAAAPGRLPARWSSTEVVAGTRLVAAVPRAKRPAGSRLVLQRHYLDRWRPADTTAVRRQRRLVLRFPTDQYGTFRLRVVAKRGAAVVARSAVTRVQVRPPWNPPGRASQHGFLTAPPTRWNSCRPIRWVFNPGRAPARGLRQVTRGVDRLEAATGLDLVYAGTTRTKPDPGGAGLHGAEVVIGWRGAGYAGFDAPGTAALGGNSFVAGYREADGTRVNRAVSGGVALNAGLIGRLRNGYGKGLTWGEVIIHELGHVVGLAHVDVPKQIMYPSVTPRRATWGAGDLAGLRRVGDSRGCLARAGGRVPATPQPRVMR